MSGIGPVTTSFPRSDHLRVEPVTPVAPVREETPLEYHIRKVNEAWSLFSLSSARNHPDLAHYDSSRDPNRHSAGLTIRGKAAFEQHSRESGVIFDSDQSRTRDQVLSYPISPFAEKLLEVLNAYHQSKSGSFLGVNGIFTKLGILSGFGKEADVPANKRKGSLTKEAFVDKCEDPNAVMFFGAAKSPNEVELQVVGSLELKNGATERINKIIAANTTSTGSLIGLIEHESHQNVPGALSPETLGVREWVPATLAAQLAELPEKVALRLMAAAHFKVLIESTEDLRRHAELRVDRFSFGDQFSML